LPFFVNKRKIITFSNGTIRGFSNKSGKKYGTVNDFKKFSIQRKTKNGTVRYGTVRKGYGDKFGRTTVLQTKNSNLLTDSEFKIRKSKKNTILLKIA